MRKSSRSSGESLLTIINDILDFSKIDARKLELEMLDFDLRDGLENVVEMFAPKAVEKGLELISIVAPKVPSVVRGDPGRLRQILINLVGNAIKFTHQGEVIIRVNVDAEDDRTAKLRLAVTDTGIGIPPDRIAALFSPFAQVDGSTTRKYGGTGPDWPSPSNWSNSWAAALESKASRARVQRSGLPLFSKNGPTGHYRQTSPLPTSAASMCWWSTITR